MKILLSAYGCDPARGSEYGNGWNWAINLADEGHEVWCFTTPRGRQSIEAAMEKEPRENLHFEFVEVPAWVERAYVNAFGVALHYLVWQKNAYKKAKILDQEKNFDLVHHVTYGSLKFASHMWKLGKPFIFGPVGGGQFAPKAFRKYFFKWWKNEQLRSWVNSLFLKYNPNLKKTIRNASIVFATNRETYEEIEKIGPKKVQLFLDSSPSDDFYPATFPVRKHTGPLRILWVGRLLAIKGLPLTFDALSRVDPALDYRLTVVGDGPLHHQMEHWMDLYGIKDKVNWIGRIPWAEIKEQYQNHDLFMFTTLRDSSPAQHMEAMAYGLPILTLDLHGSGFMVPDNAGIRVSVDDPEKTVKELAEAVAFFHKHPEERIRMGKNGYEFARTQCWEAKIARVTEIYRSLVPQEGEEETEDKTLKNTPGNSAKITETFFSAKQTKIG